MNLLTSLVRSLGNVGALANARSALDARRREDWLVQGLERRVEARVASATVAREATAAA